MERLSLIISVAVNSILWKPFDLYRGGPKISHLMFADDLLDFSKATVEQAKIITEVLNLFCAAFWQSVSAPKSLAFCSPHVPNDTQQCITSTTGFGFSENLGWYLGVPLIHRRITKTTYQYIVECVQCRLTGWKGCYTIGVS